MSSFINNSSGSLRGAERNGLSDQRTGLSGPRLGLSDRREQSPRGYNDHAYGRSHGAYHSRQEYGHRSSYDNDDSRGVRDYDDRRGYYNRGEHYDHHYDGYDRRSYDNNRTQERYDDRLPLDFRNDDRVPRNESRRDRPQERRRASPKGPHTLATLFNETKAPSMSSLDKHTRKKIGTVKALLKAWLDFQYTTLKPGSRLPDWRLNDRYDFLKMYLDGPGLPFDPAVFGQKLKAEEPVYEHFQFTIPTDKLQQWWTDNDQLCPETALFEYKSMPEPEPMPEPMPEPKQQVQSSQDAAATQIAHKDIKSLLVDDNDNPMTFDDDPVELESKTSGAVPKPKVDLPKPRMKIQKVASKSTTVLKQLDPDYTEAGKRTLLICTRYSTQNRRTDASVMARHDKDRRRHKEHALVFREQLGHQVHAVIDGVLFIRSASSWPDDVPKKLGEGLNEIDTYEVTIMCHGFDGLCVHDADWKTLAEHLVNHQVEICFVIASEKYREVVADTSAADRYLGPYGPNDRYFGIFCLYKMLQAFDGTYMHHDYEHLLDQFEHESSWRKGVTVAYQSAGSRHRNAGSSKGGKIAA